MQRVKELEAENKRLKKMYAEERLKAYILQKYFSEEVVRKVVKREMAESIDATNAAGRMMMQMVGAFAEFEREMIRERTKAGLDAARSEGRIGGRRSVLRENQKKDIIENVLSGRKTGAQMSRLCDVSEATISRVVANHRQNIFCLWPLLFVCWARPKSVFFGLSVYFNLELFTAHPTAKCNTVIE